MYYGGVSYKSFFGPPQGEEAQQARGDRAGATAASPAVQINHLARLHALNQAKDQPIERLKRVGHTSINHRESDELRRGLGV